jgi:1,2-diacylglycerol 3-alpha-glucosyltransferase
VFVEGRHALCGFEGEGPELAGVALEQAFDRRRACRGVEAGVDLARGGVDALRGAALVGNDDWQPARHRLGDAQAVRLARAGMHEQVGGGQGPGEPRSVGVEAGEVNARRSATFQPGPFRSIPEEHEHGLVPSADPLEGVDHDVPPLLHRESTDADEHRRAFPGAGDPLASPGSVRRLWAERAGIHAEGHVNDVGNASCAKPARLDAAADEGRVERGEQRSDAAPEGGGDSPRSREPDRTGEGGLEVRAHVVGMPEGRPHRRGSSACEDRGHPQVRRVSLQDGRSQGTHVRTDLVEAGKPVVAAVVGVGRPRDAKHPGAPGSRGDAIAAPGIFFIPRARRDHGVVVAELAQKVTSGRQMASNPTAPFRIEFGDVDDLHAAGPAPDAPRTARAKSSSRLQAPANTGVGLERPQDLPPFAALAARHGRPLRVAILSDFTRIPYANGAVFQTRFLYQELRRCGHDVTVIGPHDPDGSPDELAPGTVELPSVPLKTYPGVYIPMPMAPWIFDPDRWDFDICFAQTTSLLLEFGIWLRQMKGVPLLCVNTTHLVAAYDVLLPEKLSKNEVIQAGVHLTLTRPFERLFSSIYNKSDGLIVLSEGLRAYWRERGVTAPIHVIPRAVQPDVFDQPLGEDPFTHLLAAESQRQGGPRLLCAGRHTREKAQDRVIRIFAKHVLPQEPHATLTLVGDGPDTEFYRRVARELGAEHRVFFTSEVPWTTMPDFYRYADVFVHASLSETYGNVLGEALWCGTPVVAFADGMGVTAQVQDGVNGILFTPGKGENAESAADAAFGRAVVALVRDHHARARLGKAASRRSRERCSPFAVQQRIADAFQHAQDHAVASGLRPVADRPKVMQWLTTLRHARPWTAFNGLIYLGGHLRPAKTMKRERLHPRIGS